MLDRKQQNPGYWPSPWPVECGGNRRQKSSEGRLDAATGSAKVTTSRNGRWNVMVIQRDPGEWYVGGTMPAFSGPPPFGWVQRIDPETLEPLASSPELPCGEHVWCGAILAHRNGSILSVNGSFLHRLDPVDLSIVVERELPADRSHNGLLALSDGTLITKDLQLEGQGGTTISRLDPDTLETVGRPLVLPEGSMGRIAAEVTQDGAEHVYVPGTEHIWRLVVSSDDLVVDPWRPRYRNANDKWGLSWRLPAPWPGAQRLIRIDLADDNDVRTIEPFGTPGGGIIAPPVHIPEHHMAIAWDSVNGGLAGIDTTGQDLTVVWQLDVRPSMQPVVFPDSGELVINDFTDAGSDDLIVVDVRTGELLDRVATGSRIANGMFLTAGGDRDIFYCTTTTLSRVHWS